jgi:hypothetical protein
MDGSIELTMDQPTSRWPYSQAYGLTMVYLSLSELMVGWDNVAFVLRGPNSTRLIMSQEK